MATHRDASYDLIVVGSGPAGLSAAINAESEGLNTLLLESAHQLGGQAGTSSRIENYPGFPDVNGSELISRMIGHALKFETEVLAPWRVERIESVEGGLLVHDDSESILGRMVLVSSGVQTRPLIVPNLAAYLGRGVEYGSPHRSIEYADKKMFVVGGANSAGQAALHLSKFTGCHVGLLIRGKSIEEKMSEYLVERIQAADNIEVHTETQVTGVDGDGSLRKIMLDTRGVKTEVPADQMFVLVGAVPKTGWLPKDISRDKHGFINAGGELPDEARHAFRDLCDRMPLANETSVPGLFVAGDVRSGTKKRVAIAVGDGAVAAAQLHDYRTSRN